MKRVGNGVVIGCFAFVFLALLVGGACAQPFNNSSSSVAKIARSGAKSSFGIGQSGENQTSSGTKSSSSDCPPISNLADFAGIQSVGPRATPTCTSSVSQSGSQSGASPLTSYTDWAVGAYTSTDTDLSTESTEWDNLPSSFTMTGVVQASFMVNSPTSGAGSFKCGTTSETITGFLIQVAAAYNTGEESYAYPTAEVVMFLSSGLAGYYGATWSTDLGSAPISTIAEYETHDSITGWWIILTYGSSSVYLMSVSTADGIDANVATSVVDTPCAGYGSLSITSLGTTSSAADGGSSDQYIYDPSIAMEVNETTSGGFLSDNSNLAVDAIVTSCEFYYYATTTTSGFNIGNNSPPSTAWAGGIEHEYSEDYHDTYYYYDQFGTNSGVVSYIKSTWSLASATDTQTTATNLPDLNYACTGSTCPPAPPVAPNGVPHWNEANSYSRGSAFELGTIFSRLT
jgi:hypothetical protein